MFFLLSLFQLFEDYHVFKRPELKQRSEKTPELSEIDRKLAMEPKASVLNNHVECHAVLC